MAWTSGAEVAATGDVSRTRRMKNGSTVTMPFGNIRRPSGGPGGAGELRARPGNPIVNPWQTESILARRGRSDTGKVINQRLSRGAAAQFLRDLRVLVGLNLFLG